MISTYGPHSNLNPWNPYFNFYFIHEKVKVVFKTHSEFLPLFPKIMFVKVEIKIFINKVPALQLFFTKKISVAVYTKIRAKIWIVA